MSSLYHVIVYPMVRITKKSKTEERVCELSRVVSIALLEMLQVLPTRKCNRREDISHGSLSPMLRIWIISTRYYSNLSAPTCLWILWQHNHTRGRSERAPEAQSLNSSGISLPSWTVTDLIETG